MNLAPLRVSADARRLETTDGAPFFWLGDTAWELPRRLSLEDTDWYCRTRAGQGFNLIQITAVSEFSSLDPETGNLHGDLPLHDWNPDRPNEAYFAHMDAQLQIAARHGLYAALVVTWGDKVGPRLHGLGPEVFTPDNARRFGAWIGARYRDRDALVWIVGGDRSPTSAAHLETWRALAEGLRDGGARQLIAFHPQGETSSGFYAHAETWLDLNMIQSGHAARDNALCRNLIRVDTARLPRKPVLNAEPAYEDHPINWNFDNGVFSALDVRRAAYWSAFSGACGITYGHYSVFMFHEAARPGVWAHPQMLEWRAAMMRPGASQMRFLRELTLMYPDAVPAVIPGLPDDAAVLRAGQTLLIYVPDPRALTLPEVQPRRAACFDPRDGSRLTLPIAPSFAPPDGSEDWVLILELA